MINNMSVNDRLQDTLSAAAALKAQGLFAEAEKTLKEILSAHPDFSIAWNNLGAIYFAQEKWREAITCYEQALEKKPDYLDVYYNLGLAYTKLYQLEKAIYAYRALLTLFPQHAAAQFQVANLYMRKNDLEKAKQCFLSLVEQYPHHVETQVNLATCYLRLGDVRPAETHYLQALEITPEDVQVLFNVGVIYLQQGKLEKAIEYYQRIDCSSAELLDEQKFAVQNNLGFVFLVLKDKPAALQHFRLALCLQPDNKVIQHTINILENKQTLTASPPEYVTALFDSYADHFDPHLLQILKYQVPTLFYQAVMAVKQATVPWDILDLGCGTGLCGVKFKAYARSLTGVDLSANMLEIAAQKNIYDSLVHTDALTFLATKPAAYDVILAGDVLVYLGELTEIFLAVAKALKQQGIFVFDVEVSEDSDYQMTSAGRFAHHQTYLEKIFTQQNWQVLYQKEAVIRLQDNQPVRGYVYVVQMAKGMDDIKRIMKGADVSQICNRDECQR